MLKVQSTVPESPALREIVAIVMEGAGPKKAIAANVGKDRSLIRRQLEAGTITLRDLEQLGHDFAIDFAKEILETIGPLATPKARVLQRLNDIEDAIREVRQHLDYLAS